MNFSLSGTPTQVIAQLDAMARLPEYATPGAAGVDLRAAEAAIVWPGEVTMVDTGLRCTVPEGYALMLYSRSGLAAKHGIRLANGVGVVDSDFTGTIKVALICDLNTETAFHIAPGDRIAQAVLQKVERIEFTLGEMTPSIRGEGGFGSTGSA